jgi:Ca2+/Na+ antiporter
MDFLLLTHVALYYISSKSQTSVWRILAYSLYLSFVVTLARTAESGVKQVMGL